MTSLLSFRMRPPCWLRTGAAVAVVTLLGGAAGAATSTHDPQPAPTTHGAAAQPAPAASATQDLEKQLAELRAQLARLQAVLDQQKPASTMPSAAAGTRTPGGKMGGMPKGQMGGMMGEMGGMMGEMGGMSSGGASGGGMSGGMGMDMHKGEMGMPPDGMKMDAMEMPPMGSQPAAAMPGGGGGMAGMTPGSGAAGSPGMSGGATMARPRSRASTGSKSMSSLPGMPGASHLYHVGATDFFLDQSAIALTSDQQVRLNRIKEQAVLERANAERAIAQAEQEIWALTGADQPDSAKLQAKLQDVERLRTNQRLAFIRAVGEAATLLTPDQRNALLGTMPAAK